MVENLQVPTPTFPQKVASHPSIYGTWIYDFPFYSSELTIKEDSTFTFHEHGCMGHGYSEGVWVNSSDTYILTSFARYKQQAESKVEAIVNPTKSKTEIIKSTPNDSFGLVVNFPRYVLQDVTYKVSFPDTTNVYYDRIVFRLLKDTLYRLDKSGITTEAKLTFSKNFR